MLAVDLQTLFQSECNLVAVYNIGAKARLCSVQRRIKPVVVISELTEQCNRVIDYSLRLEVIISLSPTS